MIRRFWHWFLGWDAPTLTAQWKAMVQTPVIIQGELRHPELQRRPSDQVTR